VLLVSIFVGFSRAGVRWLVRARKWSGWVKVASALAMALVSMTMASVCSHEA